MQFKPIFAVIILKQNRATKLQQISKVSKHVKNKKIRYFLKRFVLMWQKFCVFVIQPEVCFVVVVLLLLKLHYSHCQIKLNA